MSKGTIIASFLLVLVACHADHPDLPQDARFRLISANESGVDFVNQLNPSENWNIIDYLYYYNGGGVSVGDIDGDALPDLYFTGNEVPDRLYRNLGNLKFEDITAKANLETRTSTN